MATWRTALAAWIAPREKQTLIPARASAAGWFGSVLESFPGAWQRNIVVESNQNILAFAAVYACVRLIADDIAKLRIKLCENNKGIWEEITFGSPYLPVLKKPNRYQTRIQFLQQWLTSLLLHGNTYVLKEREAVRGLVKALYILDPRLCHPLVAEDGSVYYQLGKDALAGLVNERIVPASEIIHDRCITLWHPLVGVTPIYACGRSATQGLRIQNNSAKFFENMSRPSGHLSTLGKIDNETAERIKAQAEDALSGNNLGRLLVTGDGLKFEPFTIPAEDSQLIEQQKWTVEDVARAFGVPLHKLQAGNPTFTNAAQFDQDYYKQTLQTKIESIEVLYDEGLDLPTAYGTELELENLLRMDPQTRAATNETYIRAGMLSPNEARFQENLPSVPGGDTPYMQQQMWSLEQLSERTAPNDMVDPGAASKPAPADDSAEDDDERALHLSWMAEKALRHELITA